MTCTYTNTQNASLDIEKQSVGGTATFDYAAPTATGLAHLHPRHRGRQPHDQRALRLHGLQLGTKDVQETPEAGWTLTNIVCTANGAEITIGTGIGGTFAQGATAGFDPGDTTVRAVITAGTPRPAPTRTPRTPRSRSPRTPCPMPASSSAYTTTGTGGGTLFAERHLLPRRRRRLGTREQPTFTFTGADATGTKTITETLPVTGWTLTNLVCSKGTTTLPPASPASPSCPVTR